MRNLIVIIALLTSTFTYGQFSVGVSYSESLIAGANKDTINTTIVIEGDEEIDLITLAIKDPQMIRIFNFYQDVVWTTTITYDGPAVVNKKGIKRVRMIQIVAICSEPLRESIN